MSELINNNALYNIGYGLYVVTCNDGVKDNGMICNTVMQVTSNPLQVVVCINKNNYSYEVIKNTKKLNVNCISVKAKFDLFEKFGFSSGRDKNKFEGVNVSRTENGIAYLNEEVNSVLSLQVEDYVDFSTHGMFICSVQEAKVISEDESMSYFYYLNNVKPKPDSQKKKGWVCKICGYVHEGDMPDDFECPLCGHPKSDFEELK